MVVFRLNEQRYALLLRVVERIVNVVDFTPLPKAPDLVLGVINVSGRIVPVIDLRARLQLPRRAVRLSDQLIIARIAERTVALLMDAVDSVIEAPAAQIIAAEEVLPGPPVPAGVLKQPDGLIVIHDLDRFLSLAEAQALDAALTGS